MEDVVVKYKPEQFLTDEPYEYLVRIQNPMERDREIAAYKKFATKNCDISAATFKSALKKAASALKSENAGHSSPETVNMTEFTGQQFALKCPGYYCNDSGVWKDSGFGPVHILMHPIMPVARIEDYETHEHKTAVSFRVGKRWTTQIVSRDVMSSRAAFTRQMSLADAFITSENCAGVITFLADVESANIDILPTAHCASRLGWHENKFLPYEDDLLFDGNARFRAAFESICEHGDSKVWFDFARKVRASNWIIERCALAASFASALLHPLKGTSFFVHIWADESGTGKTVAMMLAGSVWGNPRVGNYCQTLNTTNVGVEMMAGFLGNLPLCMDELCTRDRHDGIDEMVYNYCQNSGRIRGSRTGGIQQIQSWCNCAITTGETPIITEKSRAGAVNRVLELEANRKLFGGRAKKAVSILNENYGFAGKQFIAALREPGAWDEVKRYRDEYEDQLSEYATEKQFISMSMLLAADRFAAEHVFHDGNYLTVDDVKHLVKTDDEIDTNRRAYEWLMGTIAENNMRFEPTDEHYTGPIWGKLDESGDKDTVVCIIRSRFGALLKEQGYNDRSFLKWARREGVVEMDTKDNPTKLLRLSSFGSSPTRCVCLRMNAFDHSAPDRLIAVDLKDEERPW